MGSSSSKASPAPPPYSEKRVPQQPRAQDDRENVSALLAKLSIGSKHRSFDDGSLIQGEVDDWSKEVMADQVKRFKSTVLSKSDFSYLLTSRQASIADTQIFNVRIPVEGTPVTNQKSSGRCWLFATTNVIRLEVQKKFGGLGEFQLSQSYLFFWDKLEKSNYYLENMIDLAEKPLDDRLVQHLSVSPQNDGGQWDMAVNLVEHYGLVPQVLYPESFHSSNSGQLDKLLTSKLREYMLDLRSLFAKTLKALEEVDKADGTSRTYQEKKGIAIQAARQKKVEQMKEIHSILVTALGPPPSPTQEITWEFYDYKNKFHSIKTTPLNFYRDYTGGVKVGDEISLINDPRNLYDRLYTVERLGNIWGGRPILYVNTTSETLKQTVVSVIRSGRPVWFGCDVGKFSNSQLGVMDTALYDYEEAFGTSLGMSKAERLQTGESAMTHAMVITAAHVDESGNPVRFRVENSWAETAGTKGYFMMTAAWFDQFVYQIVVHKKDAPSDLVKIFEGGLETAVELPAWDPMGSLA